MLKEPHIFNNWRRRLHGDRDRFAGCASPYVKKTEGLYFFSRKRELKSRFIKEVMKDVGKTEIY